MAGLNYGFCLIFCPLFVIQVVPKVNAQTETETINDETYNSCLLC